MAIKDQGLELAGGPAPANTVATPPTDRRWLAITNAGAFTLHVGEFYETRDALGPGEDIRYGFRVMEHHCNLRAGCHGGMLATFLDIALARGLRYAGMVNGPAPTISMSIDFFAPALLGAWVDARVSITRIARATGFVSAMVYADGVPALRGSGVFRHAGRT